MMNSNRPTAAFGFLITINLPRPLDYIWRVNQVQATLRCTLFGQDVVTARANVKCFCYIIVIHVTGKLHILLHVKQKIYL